MEKITPADFSSDNPPERIIGVETEYNIQNKDSKGDNIDVAQYISQNSARAIGLGVYGTYLSNGSRLYADVGHAEYCTPECLGPYQAADADIAGISVMQDIVTASTLEHNGVYRISGTTLDDTVAKEKNTNGIHENFMVDKKLLYDKMLLTLLPTYMATRWWAMGGNVYKNTYEFSQKINGIGGSPISRDLGRRTTAGSKPMALLLEDDGDTVGNTHGWGRVEARFADPGLSRKNRQMGLGTFSLVLYMIEQKSRFEKGEFDDIIITNPTEAAKEFMVDLSMGSRVEVRSGKFMSMLDIGEQLAQKAVKLVEMEGLQLPADYTEIAHDWIKIIDASRRSNPEKVDYDPYLVNNFDVATKHFLLHRRGSFEKSAAEAKGQSLLYDRILPEGLGLKVRAKMANQQSPEIERLKSIAPPTRAEKRTQYIEEISQNNYMNITINWALAKNNLNGTTIKEFSDPYGFVEQ